VSGTVRFRSDIHDTDNPTLLVLYVEVDFQGWLPISEQIGGSTGQPRPDLLGKVVKAVNSSWGLLVLSEIGPPHF